MLKMEKDLFVWEGGYETRHIPKEAGLRWHGGGCRAPCPGCKAGLRLKVWWTSKPECAVKLIDLADADARQALKGYLEKIEASRSVDSSEVEDVDIPVPEGL